MQMDIICTALTHKHPHDSGRLGTTAGTERPRRSHTSSDTHRLHKAETEWLLQLQKHVWLLSSALIRQNVENLLMGISEEEEEKEKEEKEEEEVEEGH